MNRTAKRLSLATLALAATTGLFGTACVSDAEKKAASLDLSRAGGVFGTVTDAATGAPLAGALVTARDRSAVSDALGAYSISDVEAARTDVVASLDGYESVAKSSDLLFEKIDFQLVRAR